MKKGSKYMLTIFFGKTYCVKAKLLRHHESDVQLPKRQYAHATTTISAATTNTTSTTLTLQLLLHLVHLASTSASTTNIL